MTHGFTLFSGFLTTFRVIHLTDFSVEFYWSTETSYTEKCVTWYNLDRGLKITHLLTNSKHTSFPPFDFLQPGRLKFIRLFKLISSVANIFWLIVCNNEDSKQLKFISQTAEKAIYAEKVILILLYSVQKKQAVDSKDVFLIPPP